MPMERSTLAQCVPVGGDAVHAAVGQHHAAFGQVQYALEQTVGNDGSKALELQLTGLAAKVTVMSLPMTSKDLVHHLGSPGSPLPGMINELA